MGKLIENQGYMGNFAEDTGYEFVWTTICDKDGASVNPAGGTTHVYRGSSTVERALDFWILDTTGIAVAVFILNNAFYLPGYDYTVVVKTTSVDGETVSGVLFSFSIDNRT